MLTALPWERRTSKGSKRKRMEWEGQGCGKKLSWWRWALGFTSRRHGGCCIEGRYQRYVMDAIVK